MKKKNNSFFGVLVQKVGGLLRFLLLNSLRNITKIMSAPQNPGNYQ